MARAETESGLDRPGQQGRHHSCRMEAPQPYTWPGSTASSADPPLRQPCPLSHGPDLQPSPASPPGPPLCIQWEERAAPLPRAHPRDATRPERTDSDREGPLPDLLPQGDHPPRAPSRPRGGPPAEEEVIRLASQLRRIGDDINATLLQRAEGALQWQAWRAVCRGLLTFISDSLSTLYRLT